MNKYITDASFLISAIRSCDSNHHKCFQFFRDNEDSHWIVPTIAYFEYQAAQSRLKKEGRKAYRDLYIPNCQVYEISHSLIKNVAEMDLANLFSDLRGADLVYACIAKVENIPLVSCDVHFEKYSDVIAMINPTKK